MAKFLTIADIAVGTEAQPLVFIKVTPAQGKAPAKIVFQIDTHFAGTVKTWSIDFGDGLSNTGTGKPPHFAGHTYTDPAFYTVKVILSTGSDQYVSVVNVPVT